MKRVAIYFSLLSIFFFVSAGADNSHDLQEICQLTLNMSSLDKYFHIDKLPERKPLLILTNDQIQSKPDLFKFGERVKYVSLDEIKVKSSPYLEFSKIKFSGNNAYLEFLYPPEGIAGKVDFVKDERGWHIKSHKIVER
ncbi:MAG: hypothetical protein ABFD97_15370 [Syntrophobacter sp.]